MTNGEREFLGFLKGVSFIVAVYFMLWVSLALMGAAVGGEGGRNEIERHLTCRVVTRFEWHPLPGIVMLYDLPPEECDTPPVVE